MRQYFILIALLTVHVCVARQTFIKIRANHHVSNQAIIEAVVKYPLSNLVNYKVVNINNGASSVVQVLSEHKIVFVLPKALGANEVATYKLIKTDSKKRLQNIVSVDTLNEGLLVKVAGKKLLQYNSSTIKAPYQFDDIYSRSGFIHPLYSPSGKIVTDDFPVGHAHQHGIMATWASAMFKGVHHDFWNQHHKKGNVKHLKIESIDIGHVVTSINLRLQHYSYLFGEVLNERWIIKVYPFSKYFLFDIHSVQNNSSADTLFLNKYAYGGMAFRGSKEWNSDDSTHYKNKWAVFTDVHDTFEKLNGNQAAYVSVAGTIENSMAGITVFGFPDNYRYPQPIRVHPVMPYWCFSPTVNEAFFIKPGSSYSSKYRYYVHDGSPDKAVIKQLNDDLLHPVKVSTFYK